MVSADIDEGQKGSAEAVGAVAVLFRPGHGKGTDTGIIEFIDGLMGAVGPVSS